MRVEAYPKVEFDRARGWPKFGKRRIEEGWGNLGPVMVENL